jgi:hypothetical protein
MVKILQYALQNKGLSLSRRFKATRSIRVEKSSRNAKRNCLPQGRDIEPSLAGRVKMPTDDFLMKCWSQLAQH